MKNNDHSNICGWAEIYWRRTDVYSLRKRTPERCLCAHWGNRDSGVECHAVQEHGTTAADLNTPRGHAAIIIHKKLIESVHHFPGLANIFSTKANIDVEIQRLLSSAYAACGCIQKFVFKNCNIRSNLKVMLHSAALIFILLYRAETQRTQVLWNPGDVRTTMSLITFLVKLNDRRATLPSTFHINLTPPQRNCLALPHPENSWKSHSYLPPTNCWGHSLEITKPISISEVNNKYSIRCGAASWCFRRGSTWHIFELKKSFESITWQALHKLLERCGCPEEEIAPYVYHTPR